MLIVCAYMLIRQLKAPDPFHLQQAIVSRAVKLTILCCCMTYQKRHKPVYFYRRTPVRTGETFVCKFPERVMFHQPGISLFRNLRIKRVGLLLS